MGIPTPRDAISRGKENDLRITLLERRLSRGIQLPPRLSPDGEQVSDWDDALSVGFYWGSDALNGPPGGGHAAGVVTRDAELGSVFQEARRTLDETTTWTRYKWSTGVWTDWSPQYGGDTGWITLTPYFTSGWSGTFRGRRIGQQVEIHTSVSGVAIPTASGPNTVPLAAAIPAALRPAVRRDAGAYVNGLAGTIISDISGDIGFRNRSGVSWGSGNTIISTISYFVG